MTDKRIGWSNPGERNSYTWFDAGVWRPAGRPNLRRVKIVDNKLKHPGFLEQTISWDLNSGPRQRTWVEGLQPGDVVQILPKAKYQGWVNRVKECRITVEYKLADDVQDVPVTSGTLSNADHYTQRLDSDNSEIRLVVVEPGKPEDLVECSWDTIRLNDQSSFCALSYRWGDPDDCVAINIRAPSGPRRFSVHRTVEGALRRLRRPDEPLRIWIDAICINQTDIEERSQQVALMKDIFSRAEEVHIWLGGDLPVLDTCLRIIRDICAYNDWAHPEEAANGSRDGEEEQSLKKKPSELKEELCRVDDQIKKARSKNEYVSFKGIEEVFAHHVSTNFTDDDADWAGAKEKTLPTMMTPLFSNPWFGRVWVAQEAIFASRALVYGPKEVASWHDVHRMSQWLESPEYSVQVQHIQSFTIMAPIWRTLQEDHKRRTGTVNEASSSTGVVKRGILDVFLEGHDLKATDPRDKVFALLEFSYETRDISQLDPLIRPDYAKPTEDVFADFTRWWIKEHQSLAILSAIHSLWGRTWRKAARSTTREAAAVPVRNHATWAVTSLGNSQWAKASLQAQFAFRATSDTTPDLGLLECPPSEGSTLRLRGRPVSRIQSIHYYPIEFMFPYRHEVNDRSDIQAVFDRMFDPCGFTGFWGVRSIGLHDKVTAARGQREYVDHLKAHWAYVDRPKLDLAVLAKDGNTKSYQTNKLPTCLERCYFISDDGRQGICPSTAREGDMIALLDGGSVPFLLRAVGDTGSFQLVGESFVQGIMYGEYLEEENRSDSVVFSLV